MTRSIGRRAGLFLILVGLASTGASCTSPPALPHGSAQSLDVLAQYCPPSDGPRMLSGAMVCPPPGNTDHLDLEVIPVRLSQGTAGQLAEPDADHTDESDTSPVVLRAAVPPDLAPAGSFTFSFSDGTPSITNSTGLAIWHRPLSHDRKSVELTLSVIPRHGAIASVTRTFAYRDVVIAVLGDSVPSGQGVPERRQVREGFDVSTDCDRSGYAAPALAALRLQQSTPDTTIHFWHLACAGARITADDGAIWGAPLDEGGILDPYSGLTHRAHLPAQVDRLRQLVNQTKGPATPRGLPVDRLVLTAGVNDIQWATIAEGCLPRGLIPFQGEAAVDQCVLWDMPNIFSALEALPAHFDRLANAFDPALVDRNHVYITGYPDPVESTTTQPIVCGETEASLGFRVFAARTVMPRIQQLVKDTAARAGWHYVDGIPQLFTGHGVCWADPARRYANTALDSLANQLTENGTWHPNYAGHRAMADIIFDSIAPGL